MAQIYVGHDGKNPIYLEQTQGPDGESMVILPLNWEGLLKNTAMYYRQGCLIDIETADRFDNLASSAAEGRPVKLSELRWLQVAGLIVLNDRGTIHNLPLISKILGEIRYPIQCPPTQWELNCLVCTEIRRDFELP